MAKFHRISTEGIVQIQTQAFNQMIDAKWIMQTFNVSRNTACRVIKQLKLKHVRCSLIDIARRYSAGELTKSLAKEYNISTSAVSQFLKRHKIPIRGTTKYSANFRYFENIDSEDKAYFLGFIAADGCIFKNSLIITLSSVDKHILERLVRVMKSNHAIFTKKRRTSYGVGEYSWLVITHKDLVKDLAKYTIVPRKTSTVTVPEIRGELMRHFIRGYVDGDGCLSMYRHRKEGWKFGLSICGNPAFLQTIRDHFLKITKSLGYMSKRHKNSKSNVEALCYSGCNTVPALVEYLYKDSTIFLNRKYEKYLSICSK